MSKQEPSTISQPTASILPQGLVTVCLELLQNCSYVINVDKFFKHSRSHEELRCRCSKENLQ